MRFFSRFVVVAVLALLTGLPAGAQAPKARVFGSDYTVREVPINPNVSGPWCGAQGQAPCDGAPARFEQAAQGSCPSGSFFDLGKWECWSCPPGFERSVHPVDGSRACKKRVGNQLGYIDKPANYGGPLCPAGSFYDPIRGGECWSCPQGYQRSLAHVHQFNACFIPASNAWAPATKVKSTAWAWDCSGGTFWDGYGPGCYQCPSGYGRAAFTHIAKGDACVKAVPEQHAHARQVKKAQCGPGEYWDAKIPGKQDAATGGGCYSCPAGTQRTAHPVDGSRACAQEKELEFASATKVSALTCPAGQHFDFINLTQSDINTRPETKGRSDVKPVASGTCWSCPPGFSRTVAHVKSNQACEAQMGWYTAPFKEPGLFGLPGAQEVLLEVLPRNPQLVRQALDAVARKTAEVQKLPLNAALAQETNIFIAKPQESAVASGIVLARLTAALVSPQKASAAERRLVESFKSYVIARRSYIAQDAINQYNAWKNRPKHDPRASNIMVSDPFALKVLLTKNTPDFGASALLGVMASETALFAANLIIPHSEILSVALSAAGNGFADFNHPSQVAGFAARNAAEIAVGTAAAKAVAMLSADGLVRMGAMGAKSVAGTSMAKAAQSMMQATNTGARAANFVGSLGPQAVVAYGLLVVQKAIELAIDEANAPHQLNAMLGTAKSDPQLQRLAQTPEGIAEINSLWSSAVAGESSLTPQLMANYSRAAPAAVAVTAASAQGQPTASAPAAAAPVSSSVCAGLIPNTAGAAAVCGPACGKVGGSFAGSWSNDRNYPPVQACIRQGALSICGCVNPAPSPVAAAPAWLAAAGGSLPPNASIGGQHANGTFMQVCRANMGDGLHPGKVWGKMCNVGWGGKERAMGSFEVFAGDANRVAWVATSAGRIPPSATIGGKHNSGAFMQVCRANMGDGLHPGKIWGGKCNVGWGGQERAMQNFEVLVQK